VAEIKSILTSVKQVLGLAEDYEVFDQDVLMHINSTLSTLHQLGVGPADGLAVWDKTTEWAALLNDDATLNMARSYVFLRVRLLFDSTTLTGPVIEAIKDQIKEVEWRLAVVVDPVYLPEVPDGEDEDDEFLILDGGGA